MRLFTSRSDVSAASAASAPTPELRTKKRALTRTASQPTSTEVVAAVTTARSRRNTSEGLRRKPSGKGTAVGAAAPQQQQKQEAEDAAATCDPRRPSVEDLALTENLIPEQQGGVFQTSGDFDDDEVAVEYSVKKLSELDPRFVSGPGSNGSSTATAEGAAGGIGSDTESLYGIPYRYFTKEFQWLVP